MTAPEVVARAVAGDRAAFAQIWADNRDAVCRQASHLLGREWSHAEDIASSVFVKALASIDRYAQQDRDIGAWLATITRNLVYDHFKAAARRTIPYAADWALDRPDEDRAVDPADSAVHSDLAVELRRAVLTLTPAQRDVVRLRYFEDRTVEETGAALGKLAGAVKAATYRAVRELRDMPELAVWTS